MNWDEVEDSIVKVSIHVYSCFINSFHRIWKHMLDKELNCTVVMMKMMKYANFIVGKEFSDYAYCICSFTDVVQWWRKNLTSLAQSTR